MGWCDNCDTYHFRNCTGKPFKVWQDYNDEEDAMDIFAIDAETAATKAAEKMDEWGDYNIISNREAVMIVEDKDGNRFTFDITAEALPTYWAELRK